MKNTDEDWLPTRHSLLERLKNWQDNESWREFFDIYGKLIFGVALKSGLSHTEAEEVVQETVLSVSKKIEKFETDPKAGSFKAWLGQLIRWRIADRVRKRRKEDVPGPSHSQEDPGAATSTATEARIPDPAGNGFDVLWEEQWHKSLLVAATERLKAKVKPQHYQIFQLHVLKDQSVAAVAELFKVPPRQVHLIKFRLSKLLREELRSLEKDHG